MNCGTTDILVVVFGFDTAEIPSELARSRLFYVLRNLVSDSGGGVADWQLAPTSFMSVCPTLALLHVVLIVMIFLAITAKIHLLDAAARVKHAGIIALSLSLLMHLQQHPRR